MRKFICILLMLLFAIPAIAEDQSSPFAPFDLTVPEAVTLEQSEGSCTFVHGETRVVVLVIDRVPDEDPAAAVLRMMGQFDPDAVIGEDIAAAEGFSGVEAVTKDKYGEGVDALTVMLLSDEGELLILSGYNLAGSETHVRGLMDTLLQGLTVDGVPVVLMTK